MKNIRTALIRTLLAGVLVFSATPLTQAIAQTDAQKEEATAHFKAARRLYDVGRYDDAIKEYEKAYLNVEDPVFLYNIAQAYRLNDQPDEALRFYKNFLRRAPNTSNRADVEEKMADMNRLIAEREPAGASEPPPGDPAPVVVEPPPAPTQGSGPDNADVGLVEVPRQPQQQGTSMLGVGLLAGGGVLILTSTILGVMAKGKATAIENAATKMERFDPATEKSGKGLNTGAILTGIAGAVATGVGLYILLFDDGDAVASGNGHSGVALVPTITPGYAGASASLRF